MPQPATSLNTDCLIVGGGLSGLAAAAALARCGFSVVLADPDGSDLEARQQRDGRTTAIAASSRMMFETLGLWAALSDDAEPILDIRVSDGASPCALHYDHRDVGPRPMGHIVENGLLVATLSAAIADAPGVTRLAGLAVDRFETDQAGVTACLDDGRTVRAQLLVGADGRDSQIRRQAGIRITRLDYRQTSLVFCAAHEHPHEGVAFEHFLPGGPLALLPMAGNRSSVVWTDRTGTIESLMQLDDRDLATALAVRFGDGLGRFEITGGRWSFPLSLVTAQSQTAERLAIIGDAAHGLHPIAGQGFNLALRDIAVLAEETAGARQLGLDIGGAETLRRFQSRRRVDMMALVLATDGLNRLFSNDAGAIRRLRAAGLGVVDRIPALKRLLMHHAMGMAGDLPSLLQGRMP